jgi:hypothetical protein
MESHSNQKSIKQCCGSHTDSVTSNAPPHHHTSSCMLHIGNHTCRDHPFTDSVSHKDTAVGTKHLDSSGQRTDFHRSNVHWLCFLAQASLLLLLVSFSSGLFAAIQPWRPDSRSLLWTVDVKMCLLLELCEAFIWSAISEAGHSNELILCSRGNYGSSFPVAVLMRASFIIVLDGICNSTWRNFSTFWKCYTFTDLHVLR